VLYCTERFNCSDNDLINGRLPIIINSYVRNSIDGTTLDCVAFLREFIIIIIIIFIRTRSTQHEQIIRKIDETVQQILKIKGE